MGLILRSEIQVFIGCPVFFIANLATLTNQLPAQPLPAQPSRISLLPGVEHSLGLGHWSDPQWSPGEQDQDAVSILNTAEHKESRGQGLRAAPCPEHLWTFPCPASSWANLGLGAGARAGAGAAGDWLWRPRSTCQRKYPGWQRPSCQCWPAALQRSTDLLSASSVLAWPPPSIHTG